MAHHAELVLVGGGHAHLHVLKSFGMEPVPGVRLTLVTRDVETPYSGMLPALCAGQYRVDEAFVDLARLARFARARLIHARAIGIDRAARRVLLEGRPPVPYTLLSLDIGSTPPLDGVPGAAAHALPVKPVDRFLDRWDALVRRTLPAGPRLVVVGGGAAGVEMAMALRMRLLREGCGKPPVTLITRGSLLPGFNTAARRHLTRALAERDIAVVEDAGVVEVTADAVRLEDGRWLPCDGAVWATGAAPAPWLRQTGLALDDRGFVRVDRALRSPTDAAIFAVGDVAAIEGAEREKAGVFAVRQGPPLTDNLRRALADRPLRVYEPQRHFLRLVGTGDGHAVAARGPFAAAGRWVWRWKDHVDRKWMRQYQELPSMPPPPAPAEAEEMRCAGCAAKVPGGVLARALARVGLGDGAPDDAARLDLPDGGPFFQTVDLFKAPVDDPWLLGRIAALHALGDIQAMGARPLSALAIVGLPPDAPDAQEEDLVQLLLGAQEVLRAAGARLVGGHSAELGEMALGFVLTGTADGKAPLTKAGLRPGDRLVLTRPLGTGVLLAGAMRGRVRGRFLAGALEAMQAGNGQTVDILRAHGVAACTDVTGFGLGGHLGEMLRASGCDATLDLGALPVLPGALAALGCGVESTLAPANRELVLLEADGHADPARIALLADPQTAGGLLAGVPADRAEVCVAALRAAGLTQAAIIGTVLPQSGAEPLLRAGP